MNENDDEIMKEILEKYMELHPAYFCKYGWLSQNWYNNFTKPLFVCILDMYRRKKLWMNDGRQIVVDGSSANLFDRCIVDMFRNAFRISYENDYFICCDIEAIFEGLDNGKVVRLINKYIVSITEYVNKDNDIKIDRKDTLELKKYIRNALNVKQVFLRDYFDTISTDSCINYMDIIVFIYNSNGLFYDKYGKGVKTNTTVDLICKKCIALENGIDWM
ncbi:MAG: hypothetical protein ACI4DO_08410 [Roseburia sp.]